MGAGRPLIRPCEAGDVPEITRIYRHAVQTGTASFEIEPPDEHEMNGRRDGLLASGHPYLVAIAEGRLLGYAYAGPYRARPAYRGTVENSIYVAAETQGRGVGRALLSSLVEVATSAGFRQMIAVIGDSANLASIRLHEALGFDHVGILRSVGWKHERWLDTVLMQRALGAGDAKPAAGGHAE